MHHRVMRAYSVELREKMVDAVLRGGVSQEEAARAFEVGVPSVKRYAKMAYKGE